MRSKEASDHTVRSGARIEIDTELIPQVMKWTNHHGQLVKRRSIHDHSIFITSHPRDGLPLFSLDAVSLNYLGRYSGALPPTQSS